MLLCYNKLANYVNYYQICIIYYAVCICSKYERWIY